MNFGVFIDVVIGLTTVYLGASLFVTIINEYVAQILNSRGRRLGKDLAKLINEPKIQTLLAQSPALASFFGTGRKKSYVDPNVLARLLVGGLSGGAKGVPSIADITGMIETLPDSSLKTQLAALARSGVDTVDKLTTAVSDWADRTLTTMGEGYKLRTQLASLVIGFAIAISFNLDTISIVKRLYRDSDLRNATVVYAEQLVTKISHESIEKCKSLDAEAAAANVDCKAINELAASVRTRTGDLGKLPIGYPLTPGWSERTICQIALLLVGWLATALAISLGASFWFDLLNRLVNVRHGMRRPEPEGKDR